MRHAYFFGLTLLGFLLVQPLSGDDNWVQWGGQNRDFSVQANELDDVTGLSELWRRELGSGYSAILVEDGRLYTMFRDGDDEIVICLNAADGQTVWQQRYSAPIPEEASTDFGEGPNSTPLLVGDALVTIGFTGDLHCIDKSTGDVRWKLNLISDLEGTGVQFGYAASPLAYEDTIILPVGGEGRSVAAFNFADGSIAWSAQDFSNSYCSPVLASVDGLDQVILTMTDEVIAVNPKNGELMWTIPLTNQWSTHAFVPIFNEANNTLFVSSFRQSHLLQLKRDGDKIEPEFLWSQDKRGIGFTNAVRIGDVVYASTGSQNAPLITAISLEDGEFLWRERGYGLGNYVSSGNRFLVLDSKGVLAVIEPGESEFTEVVRAEEALGAPRIWTVPTLADRKVYARDQKEIVAYELQ